MIRAAEPTQLEKNMIWPATLATFLKCTLRAGGRDDSSTRTAFSFSMRSSVTLIDPSSVL